MADRIFPNRFQEDPLDSDLVFQGIDWDNFNQRLAAAENGEEDKDKGLKALLDSIGKEKVDMLQEAGSSYANEDMEDESMSEDMEDESMYHNSTKMAKKGLNPGLAKWLEENKKGKKNKSEDHEDEDHEDEEEEDHEDHAKGPMKRKGPKKDEKVKKAYVFNHPSQLSAEAVEAAEAAGDEHLKSAILAARHDRRIRLASQIETRIASEKEKSVRLAQRRAYREALVQSVEEQSVQPQPVKTASRKTQNSGMTPAMKTAFAQKALAEGFPVEYIQARIGEVATKKVDNTAEIRSVLASKLDHSTKIAAASSMIKTATLSDADYSRLIDYWKNDLGYGDQDWIDALFTKKYDKKN
jgi:hypothetical protein